MTIRHVRIFLEVCACGCNMTHAAETLHMTQPAVSLAIRELETYYGAVLFDRIGRKLVLTELGKHVQEYGIHITALFDDMETELRSWDRTGILRVGASITIGAQFLPGYVKAFASLRPEADVRATIGPSDLLEERILDNTLDFALMEGVPRHPSLCTESYMEDQLAIICPADGPFHQGQQITQEVFRQQRFLLRERGSGTREEFERVVESAGISIVPAWEAMSTTALVNAVISGLGIAVQPYRMILGPLRQGLIVTVSAEGLNFRRYFRIVYHKDKFLTPLIREFLSLCRNFELDYPLPQYYGLF